MTLRIRLATAIGLLWFVSVPPRILADEFAHHPLPKNPTYISESWYPTLVKELAKPPKKGEPRQVADEAELYQLQKSRTEADCTRAKREVMVSLENFFGGPTGPLDKEAATKLTPLFAQVRNDGDFFIQKLKEGFPRQRPFLYLKGLTPCVPKEVSLSYPSGHAALSRLFALILADIDPKQKQRFEDRAKQIAHDRVLAGIHHGSDIAAGAQLGDLLYAEFRKSPKFMDELQKFTPQAAPKK